jgi:protein-S-isoprenylcysteine O-methyltransferase Ste14
VVWHGDSRCYVTHVTTLSIAALVELQVCCILWVYPFVFRRKVKRQRNSTVTAPQARWGIGLQIVGFFVACLPIVRPNPTGFLIASMMIMPISAWLGWQAVTHLGKQWRIEAGLYSDHELVRNGPYRMLRHPIYASLLGMLIGTGMLVTWWPILIVAVGIFIAGTEIRVPSVRAFLYPFCSLNT